MEQVNIILAITAAFLIGLGLGANSILLGFAGFTLFFIAVLIEKRAMRSNRPQ